MLAPAAQVQAHGGSHQFESVLGGVRPAGLGAGLQLEVLDYDARIRLANRSGRTVIVEGYAEEPYARLDPDGGVYLNARSPALYLNNDRYARTPVAPEVDASADPEWFRIDRSGVLTWYDHRIHYMGQTVPPRLADVSERTLMRGYRIPVSIDGRPATIVGQLFWTGDDSIPVPVLAGLLLATAVTALFGAVVVRRLHRAPETTSTGD
jgi:hypothetical protein